MTTPATDDHNDMVAIVVHVGRIARRRAGEPVDMRIAVAPELVASLCSALGLDQQEVANDALTQIAAMERLQ